MTLPIPAFIKNMRLTRMIALTSAIGMIVGLMLGLMFAQKEIRREIQKIGDMKQAALIVDLSTKLSSFVHEQQKERGASAVFISSRGSRFGPELNKQRAETDKTLANVRGALEKLQQTKGAKHLVSKTEEIRKDLNSLGTLRNQVDKLEIARPQAVAEYTRRNQHIFHLIGEFSNQVDDRKLSHDLLLFDTFLSAKDYAGIERAIGASGFAIGFDDALKMNFSAKIVAQDSLFDFYNSQTDADMRQAFQALNASEISKRVAEFRNIALTGTPAEVAGVEPGVWFDAITKKINLLKRHEDKIAANIRAQSQQMIASANGAIYSVAVLVVIGILIALSVSFYFMRVISSMFSTILKPIQELSDGNMDVDLPVKTRNEFGEVVGALEIFRDCARARQESDEVRQRILDKLERSLKMLASGDFSRPIQDVFPQEYERLRKDFNSSLESMSTTLGTVVGCTSQLTQRASTLSAAAKTLSNRTDTQAATLEGVAASMEELTSSVASASTNATKTAEFVEDFRQKTRTSVSTANQAVSKMQEIESSSGEISQIVSMIEEIAFQTNLLALNAGVEAARAGDAGRGFAVVASEVRALAARSSEAAKGITTLIDGNSQKVVEGARQIERINAILTDMVEQTDQITQSVAHIATSSREQSLALTDLNTALNDLDRMTQKNTAMVDESTNTSIGVNDAATTLSNIVSTFKLAPPKAVKSEEGEEPTALAASA